MVKKNPKNNIDFERWNQENLVKRFKEDFIKFIPKSKQKKNIVEYAENIDWGIIINLCNKEIKNLVDVFEIPESFPTEIWLTTTFEIEMLKLLKDHLFYKMLFHLNKIDDKYDDIQRKRIYKRIIKQAVSDVQNIVELFKIQTKFSNLKWIKDSKSLQAEKDELKEFAEKGKKFPPGKKNRKKEVEQFKIIAQKHSQSIKEGPKLTPRSIAFHIARTELDFFQPDEQRNFYNRYLAWRIKQKNNTLLT
jgi:hypothetical protein